MHTPEEFDRNRKESQPYQDVMWPAKGEQGPQSPSVQKKVSRGVFYSSTGSGLMSGIDIRDIQKKGANGYEH
jgi:hypothetical protein